MNEVMSGAVGGIAKVMAAFLICVYFGMWCSYQWRNRRYKKDGF